MNTRRNFFCRANGSLPDSGRAGVGYHLSPHKEKQRVQIGKMDNFARLHRAGRGAPRGVRAILPETNQIGLVGGDRFIHDWLCLFSLLVFLAGCS